MECYVLLLDLLICKFAVISNKLSNMLLLLRMKCNLLCIINITVCTLDLRDICLNISNFSYHVKRA